MVREMLQSDRLTAALGRRRTLGQMLRKRVAEGRLTALNHIRQQQCREGFRNRSNLKESVAANGTIILFAKRAVSNNPPPGRLNHTDNDPDATLLLVDALLKNVANLDIRRDLVSPLGKRACKRKRDNDDSANKAL